MSPPPLHIAVSREIDAPPAAVFDTWLDAESVCQWLFATPGGAMEKVEIHPRVGGGFEIFERRGDMLATHFGTYIEIDRPRRLVFDFSTDRAATPSRVSICFEARESGCSVTLSHELDPQWAA